jgi:prevent-host-death family protein
VKLVNVREAKTHLSELLARVEKGHEVLIARAGIPIARLVPLLAQVTPQFGCDRGKFKVPDDFDAPLSGELQEGFEGRRR